MDDYKQELDNYYKTPAWAMKRNERLKLDGYKCAKCGFTRALEVHHINYERFGNEDVSRDLVTLCKKCHYEIENQKKEINPLPESKEHHSAYLAGKISENNWRGLIAGFGNYFYHSLDQVDPDDDLEVNEYLTITGPFFISCDHGCYHGPESHGVLGKKYETSHGLLSEDKTGCMGSYFSEKEVVNICKSQIDRAEILFAFIEDESCHGTLAEIGYAHAKGKNVLIRFANSELEEKMWFIKKLEQRIGDISKDWAREHLIKPLYNK